MIRRYEIELQTTVTIEVDDQVVSDFYPGETVLTAHTNRERFVDGSTLDTALTSLAVSVGVDGRRLSNVDGWADFADEAARALGWAEHSLISVTDVTP